MKLVKIVSLLTIGVALSLSSTGCKKALDRTTQIPGRTPGSLTDTRMSPRTGEVGPGTGGLDNPPPIGGNNTLGGGTTGGENLRPTTPPEGIAAAPGDFSNWDMDRDTFKSQTVYFDFDKSIVKASEIPKLEEVARRMKSEFVGKAVRVEGHCDERGTEEYNRALGDRRALSIREKLVEMGVDANMIPTISMGEEKPLDPGHTDEAWRANRRGELILLTRPAGAN